MHREETFVMRWDLRGTYRGRTESLYHDVKEHWFKSSCRYE